MKKMQKEVFLSEEGDSWFKRNKEATEKRSDFHFLETFLPYLNSTSNVLEIGCGDGTNLKFLHEKTGCVCYGVDPSPSAIEIAKLRNPHFDLQVGTADDFAFNTTFDFILFGFCLYLCDRESLSTIVAKSDVALRDKGYLGIIDFDSSIGIKKRYSHKEGIFTFKMDYSKLWLSLPHYTLVSKYPFSHTGSGFDEFLDERIASVCIYKDLESGYFSKLND